MSTIGKIVTGLSVGLFYSFVFMKLWGWFAVPMGAPAIGYLQAWGLYTLASAVLLWSYAPNAKEDQTLLVVAKGVTSSLLLLEGWVVHTAIVGLA